MHNLEGGRNHHVLFLVIGWWDPFRDLEVIQSGLASLGLVEQRASGLWGFSSGRGRRRGLVFICLQRKVR